MFLGVFVDQSRSSCKLLLGLCYLHFQWYLRGLLLALVFVLVAIFLGFSVHFFVIVVGSKKAVVVFGLGLRFRLLHSFHTPFGFDWQSARFLLFLVQFAR